MQQELMRVLDTLLSAFANPVIAQVDDRALKGTLTSLGRLGVYLATELRAAPTLRERALQDFAALCPAIEDLLRAHGKPLDHVEELARLGAPAVAANYDAALVAAKEVFLQLREIDGDAAALLRKQLAAVESAHSERVWRARDENIAATKAAAAGAGVVVQSRDYDRAAMDAFLAATFPDAKGIKVAQSDFISGGNSKYTLSLRLANAGQLPEHVVLRGDSSTSSTFGGVPVQREYELLTVLHQHGVCVPKPLAYEGTGKVFGSAFMLVEKKPGISIGHMFELPAPNMEICRDVARRLAQIHAVPLDAVGFVRGAERGTVDQVQDLLAESFANYRALGWASPVYEAAFDWLHANIGVLDRTRGLVHGDYGLNNILIDNERVATILDWEFNHIGNPAYDLGYFHYQAEALGSWQAFVDAYREAGGKNLSQEELDYSTLFAVVRLGVMVCQSYAAFRAGQFTGLGGANATINHMHETSINRMSKLLERML